MKILALFKYNKINANSLAYILAALESSDVFYRIDIELTEDIFSYLDEKSSQYDKIIVLYSIMTTQLQNYSKEFKKVQDYKRLLRDKLLLVAGGPHPTGDPKGTILKLGFDVAVVGEGEETLINILEAVLKDKPLIRVKGIALRGSREKEVVITGKRKLVDLEKYPPCSRKYGLFPPIEIMRGCPYACKYCQTPRIFSFTVRYRSIDYVKKWVKYYVQQGRKTIRFIAPNGFAYGSKTGKQPNPEKLRLLLKEVKSIPRTRVHLGNFPSEVRPEFVTREMLDIVTKYVVNKTLAIGAQSGSNRVLRDIGRQHTIEDVYEAVDLALEYGFTPCLDFIFGLPGETEEDLELTLKAIKELSNKGAVVRGHTFIPLPGTPFENAPPGKIPEHVKKELKELKEKGVLQGEWEKQEELALAVTQLWRSLL